jgi:hypothetical protein
VASAVTDDAEARLPSNWVRCEPKERMLRLMVMSRLPTLAVLAVLSLTGCGEAQSPEQVGKAAAERNESEGCETYETSRLTDLIGVKGYDSPEEAARASRVSSAPGTADEGWYVYKREGDKALLAPRTGPLRLEARNSPEASGWVVLAGLRCR